MRALNDQQKDAERTHMFLLVVGGGTGCSRHVGERATASALPAVERHVPFCQLELRLTKKKGGHNLRHKSFQVTS